MKSGFTRDTFGKSWVAKWLRHASQGMKYFVHDPKAMGLNIGWIEIEELM